jgi:hypothetical protein
MGQCDSVSIHVISAPVVRDERKNFWRDPVYGRERGLHGPNQAEHFQRVPLEIVHLTTMYVSRHARIDVFSLHLNPVRGRCNPAELCFSVCHAMTAVQDTPPVERGFP